MAKSTQEKLGHIYELWKTEEHYDVMYSWVKSGELSQDEFRLALDHVSQLDLLRGFHKPTSRLVNLPLKGRNEAA